MNKHIIGLLLFFVMFIGIGTASAFDFQTGTFGVKYNGLAFADFDYTTIYNGNSGLPLHPSQNPNDISGNIWGIFSMQGTHTLLDNNPENNNLSGIAFYTPGNDGKYYFAVFGGLTYLSDTGSVPGMLRLQASLSGAYLKVYEVDAADAGVYDAAILSGPNVPGKGAFGTFGTEIINAPSAVLWLDAVFSPGTMVYYDSAYQAGELELDTNNSSVTGSAEAYLDVIGGTASGHIKKGIFPLAFPAAPDRADLKIISDLTADFGSGQWRSQWTNSSQDPVTGEIFTPSCNVDIEKLVRKYQTNNLFVDADQCTDAEVPVIGIPGGAEYALIVTNTGESDLENCTITDPTLGINEPIGDLASGESQTFTGSDIPELIKPDRCQAVGVLPNTASIACDCADVPGEQATDLDAACVKCEEKKCCLEIIKTATPVNLTCVEGLWWLKNRCTCSKVFGCITKKCTVPKVKYTYKIKNLCDPVKNVKVVDVINGKPVTIASFSYLGTGQEKIINKTRCVCNNTTNTATVKGYLVSDPGTFCEDSSDTITVTVTKPW